MKKYVKPELFYERYELSQHIADCAWEMNYSADKGTTCVGTPDDKKLAGMEGTLFVSGTCTYDYFNSEDFCVENSMPGVNTFIS